MAFMRLKISAFLSIFCIQTVDPFRNQNLMSYDIQKHNLSGIQILATAPEGNLTQGEVTYETVNGDLRFKSGFGVDILSSLQIALGFRVKVIPTKGWALQYTNGSWFGMAKEILDGKADLTVAKTSILPNRAKDFTYLVPTHGLGLYAFFIQPSSNSGREIFLDPFENKLWICLIFAYLSLTVSVKVIANLAAVSIRLSSEDKVISEDWSILSFYLISQQGYYCTPKMTSLRIALVTGVFLGLVIYISYSATLVSMFSIESVPIKSIQDLLRSTIRISVDVNNQAAKNLIQGHDKKNSDLVSTLLRKHLKEQHKSQLSTATQGGKNVLNGHSAFLSFKDTFYTTLMNTFGAVDSEFCGRITAIPVTDVKFRSGLFVPKGSPLKEPFNTKIIALYTGGLMRRFVKHYDATYTPTCNPDGIRSTPSINMADVVMVFYIIIVGVCVALCIYLIELAYCIFHKKKNYEIQSEFLKFLLNLNLKCK